MNLFSGVILAGVLLAMVTIGVWWKKGNLVEILVLGVTYWFCAWIVVCMGLFVLDEFRLFRAAALTAGLLFLVGVAAVFVRWKHDKTPLRRLVCFSWNIRPYWIPILVCCCGVLLVFVKNGMYGMGQDEGVYQTVAINFMNGITDRQQDFSEYHLLSPEQQTEFEADVRRHLVGYDIGESWYPDTVYDETISPVSGIFHGIPTFAATLAMWGTIFGMSSMQGVQTLFYFLMIFLVYFTCQNLKLRKSSGVLACVLMAAAPVVVWTTKSALTEPFLGVLFALFLYFITEQKHPERQWMSIFSIAVFGCYHVSIYTMLPVFLVVYGGMYWLTRRRSFAILMPVTVIGYLISFFAMRHVQPFYTMNNYSPLFVGGISQKDLPVLISLVCTIALVVCGVYVWLVHRLVHQKYADVTVEQYQLRLHDSKWGWLLVELLLVPLVLYIVLKWFLSGDAANTAQYSSLVGFLCNTGVFAMLLAWIVGMIRPRFYLKQPLYLVVLVLFAYCVLFYSAFLRSEVRYYYYYGRYLVPFLPVLVIFAALTLDRLRARVTLPVALAGLIVVAPYDRFLSVSQDDTWMDWDVMEDLADQIGEEDCLIVTDDFMKPLYLTLRAMTGADIYPVLGDDAQAQAEELGERYRYVYYIGDVQEEEKNCFELRYRNVVTQSEDYCDATGKLMPLSLQYHTTDVTVKLYRYLTSRLEYQATDCWFELFQGVGSLEQKFCWTNTAEANVNCYLDSNDYTLVITMGCALPMEALKIESYPVQIQLNGKSLETVAVTEKNNGKTLTLDVPAEMVEEGENTVTLQCDLWEASQVAAGDARMLGFPLESLEFVPTT